MGCCRWEPGHLARPNTLTFFKNSNFHLTYWYVGLFVFTEFVKWKFLIEKQAKLKSHIHDPNAPELVHFLFSPLTLIAEASHESKSPNLPARVVAPLLTYDAIELLSNCLSSKETELWHSLGDAWHTPKYVFFPSLKSHDANFIMSCDW